jgi:hypothetical protein
VIPIDEQGTGKMKYTPLESSDESLARKGDFHSSAMTGLLVSLYAPGKYSVSYHQNGSDQEIPLCFNGTHSAFEVLYGQERFISSVGKCPPTQLFSISTEYTSSLLFTLSDRYSASRFLNRTDLYESSRFFTPSVPGPQSKLFAHSHPYSLSQSFTRSVPYPVSELFICSDTYTLSQFFAMSTEYTLLQLFTLSIPMPSSSRTQLYTPNHAGGRNIGNSSIFIGVGIAVPLVIIAIIVLTVLKTKDESTEECQESQVTSEVSDAFDSIDEKELLLTDYNEDVKLRALSESCEESNLFQILFNR